MENIERATLVFTDQAGEFYLLPQALLERGHVPAARRAEVERLMTEQADARGHSWHVVHAVSTPVSVILVGGYLIWQQIYDQPLGHVISAAAEQMERQTR